MGTNFFNMLRVTAALAGLSLPAICMGYAVRGHMVEAETGDDLMGAPYNIYAAADTLRPVVSGAADMEGRFAQEIKRSGKYVFKVQYAGRVPLKVAFEVSDAASDVDLGVLKLSNTDSHLDEVEVVARRELIRSDGAKLTYDVERDPSSATNTVMEMLRKVPMVSVDGDDNIKVKGDSNFKIYINGKPDPMLSGDPKSVLKAMPASSIKRIEVITDPGARYEAEGTAGILNIITVQKQSLEGYTGTARIGVSNSGYNVSLYARTKIRNVTASARVNGYNGRVLGAHNYSHSEREDFSSDLNHWYRTDRKGINKFSYWMGGLDVSWEPDSLNLFTVSASYQSVYDCSRVVQSLSMSSIDEVLQWSYRRRFCNVGNNIGVSANVSYQHTFPGNKQHSLTFTYQFDYGKSPQDNNQYSYDYVTFPGSHEPYMLHNTLNFYSIHTLQADYVLPLFSDKHTLEAGAKAVIRPNRESEWNASSPDGLEYVDDKYIKLTQHNDVYAGYVSYNLSVGRFSGRAGLRYEHTRLGIDYHRLMNVGEYDDFNQGLNDWVPNASVTYKLSDPSNLRLAYSMRIRRPRIGQLNPFRNDLTFGEIDYGNPDLKSAKVHSLELKYSNYGGKLGGEMSVSYRQSDNSITNFEFMDNGVLNSTYANIGKYRNFDLGAYVEYEINSLMNASVWLGGCYEDYKAPGLNNLRSHGWQGVVNMNYSYTMPLKIRLDAWGGTWSPWIDLQGKGDNWGYYYGFAISRNFLPKDALRISMNVNNFLQSSQTYRNISTTATTRTQSSYIYKNWRLGLSVSYNFGSLRNDVRRTRASVDNDDVSTGSSGSQGKGGGGN